MASPKKQELGVSSPATKPHSELAKMGESSLYNWVTRKSYENLRQSLDRVQNELQKREKEREENLLHKLIAERRFRHIFDASPDGLIIISKDGRISDANAKTVEMFAYDAPQLKNQKVDMLITDQDRCKSKWKEFTKFRSEKQRARNYSLAISGRKKNGEPFPMEVESSQLTTNGQEEIVLVFRDMTEKTHADEALKTAQSRLSVLCGSAPVPIVSYTCDSAPPFKTIVVSPNVLEVSGYTAETYTAEPDFWFTRIHMDDQLSVEKEFARLNQVPEIAIRYRWRTANGRYRWFVDRARSLSGLGIDSIVGSRQEITDSLLEASLAHAERHVLEMGNNRHAPLEEMVDCIITELEKVADGMLGSVQLLSENQTHLQHLCGPSLPAGYVRAVRSIPVGDYMGSCGTSAFREQRVIVSDIPTDPLWREYRRVAQKYEMKACWSEPIFDSNRRLLGTFGLYSKQICKPTAHELRLLERTAEIIAKTIERKRAYLALSESERKYRTLVEDSQDAIFISTPEGRILQANKAMLDQFGYRDDEMNGIDAVKLYKREEDRKRLQMEMEKRGAIKNFPVTMKKKDDVEMDIVITATALRDEGRIFAYQGILRDITESNRKDAEIRSLNLELGKRVEERTKQLEAANEDLKAFSYSVSHDLKAPLRAIDGFAKILVEEFYDKMDPSGKDALDEICSNTDNMRELVDALLEFFHLGEKPMTLSMLDMEFLVQSVVAELKKDVDHAAPDRHIQFAINGPLLSAHGDKAMIRQVLVNIIANSIKFTRPRKEALIEIGCQDDVDHVCYCVKDNGVGFDMRYVDKVFAVFQRLHLIDEFEGTGVGLALVQRIIHRHGGSVSAEGIPNHGAAIYFRLKKRINHGAA